MCFHLTVRKLDGACAMSRDYAITHILGFDGGYKSATNFSDFEYNGTHNKAWTAKGCLVL